MLSEETEEDIYDFSGVSYDLTSLRSDLMRFGEKPKTGFCDKNVYEISETNKKCVLPSSSNILSRSNGRESKPPKLPPKEKGANLIFLAYNKIWMQNIEVECKTLRRSCNS